MITDALKSFSIGISPCLQLEQQLQQLQESPESS